MLRDARGEALQVGLTMAQADSLAVLLSAMYLERTGAPLARRFDAVGGTLALDWSPSLGGELTVTIAAPPRSARRVLAREAMRTMQGGVLAAAADARKGRP